MVNRIEHINTAYALLIKAFGEPGQGDPDKTLAEWQMVTPFGWAEIYDYKAYVDRPEDVEEWHVQAETPEAFEWLWEQLATAEKEAGAVSSATGSEGN